MTQDASEPTPANFTVTWSPELRQYVAKCDVRPEIEAASLDAQDALADLEWLLEQGEGS